ncbi:hypothetical protein M2283_005587 [Streptomyces pseudovenezuelae]|uniref:Uncharacterized protein n=1 Tax=Streptomyces pseudovenezuelae TaxID=67350 RepID=A0ABT6LPM7_9ACTN|nr:hypothetical protein [Streptomyces pseudovenezuelae]
MTKTTPRPTVEGVTSGRDQENQRNPQNQQTRTVSGTLPPGAPDYVYVPVEVPDGVRELWVSYSYDRPSVPAGTPGNALDIGLFDERGIEVGGAGFRGCGWGSE